MVRGLLSSCGMQVFSSLVVAHRLQGAWALVVCSTQALSLWCVSSIVVARELSSCGT